MSELLPLIVAGIPFAAMLGWALHQSWKGSIHYLPSIGWLILATLPFFVEYPLFYPATRDVHLIAIAMIAIALFASDFATDRYLVRAKVPMADNPRQTLLFALALGAVFVTLSAWHLLHTERIPLFDILAGIGDEFSHADARNQFSRDAAMPVALRYILSFAPAILAIPAVLLMIARKKYLFAGILLAWTIFYAVAGSAKSPAILAVLVLAVGLVIQTGYDRRTRILRCLMIAGMVGLFALSGLSALNPYNGILKDLPEKYAAANIQGDSAIIPSLGDYERARAQDALHETPLFWRKTNYLLYRIFFTPIEVSSRWYEYFHRYPMAPSDYKRLIVDSRTDAVVHPANAVGRWAYYERYPNSYTEGAYAYSSVDADAHARYGWAGLGIAALLLAALRLWIGFFNDLGSRTRGAFYAAGIATLAYLPSSASLQAILVPQGLGVLALIMAGLYAWDYVRAKKS